MDHSTNRELENFKNFVGIKFQLYNSLFTSLPFHRIEKTGIMLSLFLNHCEEGYKKHLSPSEIVNDFFSKYTSVSGDKEKTDVLFRFVQYAERQVVLFDALEDASIKEINDTVGAGTLKQLDSMVLRQHKTEELLKCLEEFAVALVLTAHPTQFYPGSVLGIINDLSRALKENNVPLINMYLQQLGKTPLFKKQRPTPYDEAVSLIWYLENVFYNAIGRITSFLKEHFPEFDPGVNNVVKMGFWPGGDRDGNPNVTSEITLRVADALRSSIIKCYYVEVRKLKRRLTFKGVDTIIADLEAKLYKNIFIPDSRTDLSREEILQALFTIRDILIHQHNGLFMQMLDQLIYKVQVFGLYFARLDIRQESTVHTQLMEAIAEKQPELLGEGYGGYSDKEKIDALFNVKGKANPELYDGILKDTLLSVDAVRVIRERNGSDGCERYIISQCNSVLNVIEVFGLFLIGGWNASDLPIDIVPLFETIEDLKNAGGIMRELYSDPRYFDHVKQRGGQTIMVGFSDGTKDGGYLMANWSIYRAKEELTRISNEFGVSVVFFDGRGGPPARGGGKTHKFYASMGSNISAKEIHLTIQGQTVSSNFGNIEAAQFNIEQLLHAGISNQLFSANSKTLNPEQEAVIQELSDISFDAYKALKNHPDFMDYLTEISPLNFYADTNISSRPSKRGRTSRLTLKDLRAIPFVGAWSQIKQNVPGYYGLGLALEQLENEGKLNEVKNLYKQSQYFRTLMDNCEMAMKKSFFPLTAYLSNHPRFGQLWNQVHEEYQRTEKYLLKLSGENELMGDYPVERLSIQMRERIVLPLTTIQQYGLIRLRDEGGIPESDKEVLGKLIVRTSFGIINAGRNSV